MQIIRSELYESFFKFYYRNFKLISKYKCNLKALLRLGISHPEFYGDVIYKLRKIFWHRNFNTLFTKRIDFFFKNGLWSCYRSTTTHCMFGCQPLYSWQSRLPLWVCDDRTDLVLNDDVGLNPGTEGRRRILLLCSVVSFTVFLQLLWLQTCH